MSQPRIELFGGFRLILNGRSVSLSTSQKAVVLLAYLACRVGKERPREVIIEALWPESEPESGRTRLRTVLSDLRKLLADHGLPETEILAASRGGVSLDSELVTTDVSDFERLIHPGHDMKPQRILNLESALSLYKGELLPGFYEEWAQNLRDEMAHSRAAAVNELAALYESDGKPDRAAAALAPLVKEDALNEDAQCEIMRLHLAARSPSAALKQYAELTRILREELDVDPCERAQTLASLARMQPNQSTQVGPVVHPPGAAGNRARRAESVPAAIDSGIPAARQIAGRRWAIAALCAIGLIAASVGLSQFRKQNPRSNPSAMPVATARHKEPAWVYQFDPKEGDKGSDSRAIAVDRSGNVYIAGFVETADNDVDFLVVKLDRNGYEAWPEPFRYNGPGDDVDRAYDLKVDELGNVYVTGDSDNGTNESKWTTLDSIDFCTIKIGPDGNPSRTWPDIGHGVGVRRYNGPDNGEDMPKQILLDRDGSVYVLGYSLSRKGGKDMAVVRYDQNGKRAWVKRFDGAAHDDDIPSHMSLDGEGTLYVTGTSRGGPKDAPEGDMVVTKYHTSNGEVMWSMRWGANNQFDDGGGMVLPDHENIYVYGIGRTGPGTFNHQRPGLVVFALEARSGKVVAARGAASATDHLDRFISASQSRIIGEYEGETRVVYRDMRRSEFQSKHANLTGVSILHGIIGTYIVGTIPVAPAPDQPAIPKIRTTGLSSEWIFPGLGGLPHTSRAATIWLNQESNTHVRQWVLITGQYGSGAGPHVMALAYNAHVVPLPPSMRGIR